MQNKTAYVWGLFSRFAPSGIQLLTNMYLARLLSPQDFGTIGVLAIIFTVSSTLIDAGLGGSLIKEENLKNRDLSTITTFNLATAFLIYAILYFSADCIEYYFNIEGIGTILQLLSLTVIISSFSVVPNSLLIKACLFKTIFKISISSILIASLVSLIMAHCGFGVYSLVWYQITYSMTQAVLSNIFSKYRIRFGFYLYSMKKLLPFGIYTSLITAMDAIYENILTTLTGKYLNVKVAGYVSQSKRLDDALSYSIAMTIGTVTFPILTRLRDSDEKFIVESASIYKTIILLLTPLLMIVAAYSYEIIILLFGSNWGGASMYLAAFMFAGIFLAIEALLNGFIKAKCIVDKLALITLVKRILGIMVIIMTLIYNPIYVVYGYVLSTIIGFMMNAILYCQIMRINVLALTWRTIIYITPSIIVYLLIILFRFYCCDFIIQLAFTSFVTLVYYTIFLRIFNINIISKLKSI